MGYRDADMTPAFPSGGELAEEEGVVSCDVVSSDDGQVTESVGHLPPRQNRHH